MIQIRSQVSVSHSDCQQTRALPCPGSPVVPCPGRGQADWRGAGIILKCPQQSPAGGVHGGPDPSLLSPPDPTQGGKSSVGAAAMGIVLHS